MKAIEVRAIADRVDVEALMDDAGAQIATAVRQFFPQTGKCLVYYGKGHNGGDALVAARLLSMAGWRVELAPVFGPSELSSLTGKKLKQFEQQPKRESKASWPFIVLDGLIGIGTGGVLRDPIKSACKAINKLRRENHAFVFAIDIPSGVSGDSGAADSDAVIADTTLTIGFVKTGLLADQATRYVGRIAVLPLEELSRRATPNPAAEVLATANDLAAIFPRRNFDTHKGDFGRIGIVAGSPGFTGAAAMCAEGALRGGAGLVSLYVTPDIYPLVAARCSPEIMVRPVATFRAVLHSKHDVLAIGPGLGQGSAAEVLHLIERATPPIVIDADALNVLAGQVDLLSHCAGPRLLTPHPGEMARLDPGAISRSRHKTATEFTKRFPAVLLLKGARSLIAERGKPFSYNSTGNPGLGTGGVGDVMTGLLAGLAGQRLGLYDAARLGAWLIGRAAERAVVLGTESEESLTATRLLAHLGGAFDDLRARAY